MAVSATVICAGLFGAIVFILYKLAKKKADKDFLDELKYIDKKVIPITLLPDNLSVDIIDHLKKAVAFWNTGIGMKLFMDIGDISRGLSVPVISYYTDYQSQVATAHLTISRDTKSLRSASIRINKTMFDRLNDEERFRAIAHELGHLLGLQHDDIRESIMYGRAIEKNPEITLNDIDLIRKNYGV